MELRADVIAEAVWGEPIKYDTKNIQCIGRGKSPRPRHLPDEKARLKANPVPNARVRQLGYPVTGTETHTVYVTDGRKRRAIERALEAAGVTYSFTSKAEILEGEDDPHFRRHAKALFDFNVTPEEYDRVEDQLADVDGWSWSF